MEPNSHISISLKDLLNSSFDFHGYMMSPADSKVSLAINTDYGTYEYIESKRDIVVPNIKILLKQVDKMDSYIGLVLDTNTKSINFYNVLSNNRTQHIDISSEYVLSMSNEIFKSLEVNLIKNNKVIANYINNNKKLAEIECFKHTKKIELI